MEGIEASSAAITELANTVWLRLTQYIVPVIFLLWFWSARQGPVCNIGVDLPRVPLTGSWNNPGHNAAPARRVAGYVCLGRPLLGTELRNPHHRAP